MRWQWLVPTLDANICYLKSEEVQRCDNLVWKCMQCLEILLFGHWQQVQVPRPPTYTFILNITALFNLHIYKRLVELDRRAEPSLSFREPVKKKLDSFSFHNDRIALSLCILLLTVLVCQKQCLRNWHNDSSVVLCGYVVQNLKHRYRMNENKYKGQENLPASILMLSMLDCQSFRLQQPCQDVIYLI